MLAVGPASARVTAQEREGRKRVRSAGLCPELRGKAVRAWGRRWTPRGGPRANAKGMLCVGPRRGGRPSPCRWHQGRRDPARASGSRGLLCCDRALPGKTGLSPPQPGYSPCGTGLLLASGLPTRSRLSPKCRGQGGEEEGLSRVLTLVRQAAGPMGTSQGRPPALTDRLPVALRSWGRRLACALLLGAVQAFGVRTASSVLGGGGGGAWAWRG